MFVFYAVALAPFVLGREYVLSVIALGFVYAAINLGWGLLIGTSGIFSFAPLVVVGAGAYGAAIAAREWNLDWPLLIPIGGIVGLTVGVLVHLPALRVRGVYFALFTMGLVELFRAVTSATLVLGGRTGITGVPRLVPDGPSPWGKATIAYYAAFALLVAVLAAYQRVGHGRIGLLLRLARDSETIAGSLAVNVVRTRLLMFAASSGILGLVGGFYVVLLGSVSPTIFRFELLLLLIAMIVVGGSGSSAGILLGTSVLLFVDRWLLVLGPGRLVVVGALMLTVALALPKGLVGVVSKS